jgi:hypothetical protein
MYELVYNVYRISVTCVTIFVYLYYYGNDYLIGLRHACASRNAFCFHMVCQYEIQFAVTRRLYLAV